MSSAALFRCVLRRRIRRVNHRYERATLETRLERDLTLGKGIKGVVLAHAHVLAGPELGAALTHDDVAAGDLLATEQFHAQHLGVRVATVARGTACFLVCHTTSPSNLRLR